jgi:hypothetical protein
MLTTPAWAHYTSVGLVAAVQCPCYTSRRVGAMLTCLPCVNCMPCALQAEAEKAKKAKKKAKASPKVQTGRVWGSESCSVTIEPCSIRVMSLWIHTSVRVVPDQSLSLLHALCW